MANGSTALLARLASHAMAPLLCLYCNIVLLLHRHFTLDGTRHSQLNSYAPFADIATYNRLQLHTLVCCCCCCRSGYPMQVELDTPAVKLNGQTVPLMVRVTTANIDISTRIQQFMQQRVRCAHTVTPAAAPCTVYSVSLLKSFSLCNSCVACPIMTPFVSVRSVVV